MKKFLPLLNWSARNGPFLPKFWTALETVIVGIFFEKNFGEVLDQYQLPTRRSFEYLEKNGVFKFFGSAISPPITMSAVRPNDYVLCYKGLVYW